MQRRARGFTLVELMVAVAALALMGSMSWLGLDALLRSKAGAQDHAAQAAAVQIAMGQWSVDLDHALDVEGLEPMGWDGKVFRITRRAPASESGLVVAAWAVRAQQGSTALMRWESRTIVTTAQWQTAWQDAAIWARSSGQATNAVALLAATDMDIAIWSDGSWVNAQSSQAAAGQRTSKGFSRKPRTVVRAHPMGVKLKLTLRQGVLEKDWVSPLWVVNRS